MVTWILSKTFPPNARKLGKIENIDGVLLLQAIRSGEVRVESESPRESGIGRVFEWGDGRAFKPTRVMFSGAEITYTSNKMPAVTILS